MACLSGPYDEDCRADPDVRGDAGAISRRTCKRGVRSASGCAGGAGCYVCLHKLREYPQISLLTADAESDQLPRQSTAIPAQQNTARRQINFCMERDPCHRLLSRCPGGATCRRRPEATCGAAHLPGPERAEP